MIDRSLIARTATRAAFQARRSLAIPRDMPVNAFDVAESLGVEVRFVDAPSLEGMFSREPHPLIVLPSRAHRPLGRLAYTCAHELGHCLLGHGERVDKLVDSPLPSRSPEEYAADVFAAALLMPRPTIISAFERRRIRIDSATPKELFTISCELGVGLSALINQISLGLSICNNVWRKQMLRHSPKSIRHDLIGTSLQQLVIIDNSFAGPSIDVEISEVLLTETNVITFMNSGQAQVRVEPAIESNYDMYTSSSPGIVDVRIDKQQIQIRVSRKGYVGPHRNRFLRDPEAE